MKAAKTGHHVRALFSHIRFGIDLRIQAVPARLICPRRTAVLPFATVKQDEYDEIDERQQNYEQKTAGNIAEMNGKV